MPSTKAAYTPASEEPAGALLNLPKAPIEPVSHFDHAMRWLRDKLSNRSEGTLKTIIQDALEEDSAEGGLTLREEERTLLKNMVHFGELTVRDVMIPRTEITGLRRDVTLDELKRHVVEMAHTRIPVYDDSLDQIDGFIHVKDLFPYLASGANFEIGAVLREVLFVPPSMRILDLLLKMRVSACHMGIVVDEYGGTSGLVTMEDLFEELVGEIQDEHDDIIGDTMLRWVGSEVLEADARVKIEQIEQTLGETLHSEGEDPADYDTLGGFIFFTLGRVPVKGEVLKIRERLKIEITAADPRRIRQVRITRLHPPQQIVAA